MMFLGLIFLALTLSSIGGIFMALGKLVDTEYGGPGLTSWAGIGIVLISGLVMIAGFLMGAIKYLF